MQIYELGHVVLFVTSLTRSADFYRGVLGFREIARDRETALFSSGRTHHELLLIEVGGTARRRGAEPGLYHIGFKVGTTDAELEEALKTVKQHGTTVVGAADHTVTHSLYILDPDGNELELYIDVSDEWKKNPTAILNPTKRLHLKGLL
jgi:catechol-2,3-dioxygenase